MLFPHEAATIPAPERATTHITPKTFTTLHLFTAFALLAALILALFSSAITPTMFWLYLALMPVLTRLLCLDVQYHVLANIYILPLAIIGLITAGFTSQTAFIASALGLFSGLLGGLFINATIRILTGKNAGMGGGDIKFLAAAGAWLGVGLLPVVLWLALAVMLPLFFFKRAQMPFGPALILAFWLTLLYKNTVTGLIMALPLPI